MQDYRSLAGMAKRPPKDVAFERRIRAYVRQGMARRGWGTQRLSDETGFDQGYLSKWLAEKRGERGISALLAARLCAALRIDPVLMFTDDQGVAEEYRRVYVPQARELEPGGPARASAAPAHPPRRTRGGGAR